MSLAMLSDDRGETRGLAAALFGDGRFLIVVTGLSLVLAGAFALFQAATGHFLPHDIEYLGMTAADLCGLDECRIVHFMMHDRVSFGGVIITIGLLYMWLAEFPLRAREAWAWWALASSGVVGFASFLTYLGYGYLDAWHAAATLLLLPCFTAGMVRAWFALPAPYDLRDLPPARAFAFSTRAGRGRAVLLLAALGMLGAGMTITTIGMTTVFVPQDLRYMGVTAEYLQAINPRLVPLIAHDRAGFGGGLCLAGIALATIIYSARASRSLWQILALSGVGFTAAIAVHFVIGYDDVIHVGPACLGAIVYVTGLSAARAANDRQ